MSSSEFRRFGKRGRGKPFCAYAQEKSHVAPEQVDRAIREIEKLAQKEIQENALPGLAIAIVFQDKVRYAKGFGVRDVNTKMPVDADTVFQLASVSKSVGSTVVAEVVGEGKITWDSKLSVLDPTFAMFDPWVTREITILCDGGRERCWQKRHHLYHRAGWQGGTGRRGKSQCARRRNVQACSRRKVVKRRVRVGDERCYFSLALSTRNDHSA
jgi:Beta-lactamase